MISRLALALFAPLLFSACHSGTGPQNADLSGAPEPAELLAQLRRLGAERTSMRSDGRVTAFGPEGRIRLRAILVAQRPSAFRVETLTPFEQPIDVMVSGGERLWLLSGGTLYEGAATAENVARLLPMPLRPEEVVETLLGGVPLSDRFVPTRVDDEDGRWVLVLDGPGGETGRLRVDPGTLRVLEAEVLEASGEARVKVRLDGYERAEDGGPAVPLHIDVEVPSRELEVRIRLQQPETNVEMPESIFEMAPPPGAEPAPIESFVPRRSL